MKIRNKKVIRAAAWGVAWVIRGWMATVRYDFHSLGPHVIPCHPDIRGRYLYAFWHENMLLPAYQYGRPDVNVLISQHADGEWITQTCRNLHLNVVRGSTTRGGVEALRQMMRLGKDTHLVITPDGPRGPRRQVQPGLVYLAARTGLPIVPTGVAIARRGMKNWDRFALPKPFTFGTVVTGAPFSFRPTPIATLESCRLQVEQSLTDANDAAERGPSRATTAVCDGGGSGVRKNEGCWSHLPPGDDRHLRLRRRDASVFVAASSFSPPARRRRSAARASDPASRTCRRHPPRTSARPARPRYPAGVPSGVPSACAAA